MHTYEWLTVAAVFATVFAFMTIHIYTRRAQIKCDKARRSKFYYRKSTQRGGLNRRKVL